MVGHPRGNMRGAGNPNHTTTDAPYLPSRGMNANLTKEGVTLMKQYWIYYRGTGYGMYIMATGSKEALLEFAQLEGKPVNAYMTWKRA